MTSQRRTDASRGAGFTLVEVLIVIVIIGLLAGMTTSVVVGARKTVNNSVVSTQMAQLSIALDEYKNRYGEYPPDLSDEKATMRHIQKRWPRYDVTYEQFQRHIEYGCKLSSSPAPITERTLAEKLTGNHCWELKSYYSSLIFWLGGLPNEDGVPSGFYASPKYPLGIGFDQYGNYSTTARPNRMSREKPLFSFDKKYILPFAASSCSFTQQDSNGNVVATYNARYYYHNEKLTQEYIPTYCIGGRPILYFRPSANYGYSIAVPYAKSSNSQWYEENRFQLIHPGADGLFSVPVTNALKINTDYRTLQPKRNVNLEDDDNLTNFLENGTLTSEYN